MKHYQGYEGNATRQELLDILGSRIARVVFTKVNGEERVMKCTLSRSVIPEHVTNNGRGWHTDITGTLSVWDVEKNDWRAFRIANVISIEWTEVSKTFS